MNYSLHFRYVYTFYSYGEEEDSEIIDESIPISEGTRLTLRHQEDGSFLISALSQDRAVLTFPNKDNLVLMLGDEAELAYDEFVEILGNPSHNVYEGIVTLIAEA